MSGDAYYPNVSLLLHCDGTDGSTTFTDSSPSPKTVTVAGNAHIETDQSKFGGASAAFDGAGDSLATASSTAWEFGTGDFTIDFFVKYTGTPSTSNNMVLCYSTNWNTANGWYIDWGNSVLNVGNGSVGVIVISFSRTPDVWQHIAFSRSSGTVRAFNDGVKTHEETYSGNIGAASQTGGLQIGKGWSTAVFSGYLDEIRITKGVARYTADFTAPTAAFLNYAGQIAGVITDDASDPVARVVRAYRRDTGALVGNTTSSAADGSYSMDLPTLEQCSVIALDDAAGDVYNDLIARVTPA